MLSWVLVTLAIIMFIPYLFREFRCNRHGCVRSVSGMIVRFRPLGHFTMSLANLIVFEIFLIEHKEVAWLYWVALQLVLSFDIDEYPVLHFTFLLCYIAMLTAFWAIVCVRHNFWEETAVLWASTGAFSLVWLLNMTSNQRSEETWPYQSLQAVMELIWVISLVVCTFLYEKMMREENNVRSTAVNI